jgi:hypothetical protein
MTRGIINENKDCQYPMAASRMLAIRDAPGSRVIVPDTSAMAEFLVRSDAARQRCQPFCCWKYDRISDPALWPGCVSRSGWQLQVFALIVVGLSRCLSELISHPGTSW